MTRICKICGKEFETIYHFQITCSKECSLENKRRRSLEYRKIKKEENRKPAFCKCGYCGTTFERKHHREKYCSEGCRKAAIKKQKTASMEKKRAEAQKPNDNRNALAEICAAAKAAGMTYGQYVSRHAV